MSLQCALANTAINNSSRLPKAFPHYPLSLVGDGQGEGVDKKKLLAMSIYASIKGSYHYPLSPSGGEG
jgi:hypothetical protein